MIISNVLTISSTVIWSNQINEWNKNPKKLAMLISGLWGIFYFGEVQGGTIICKWFLSAIVAVIGIIVLSYEHHTQWKGEWQTIK